MVGSCDGRRRSGSSGVVGISGGSFCSSMGSMGGELFGESCAQLANNKNRQATPVNTYFFINLLIKVKNDREVGNVAFGKEYKV